MWRLRIGIGLIGLFIPSLLWAASLHLAVAANFSAPMQRIAQRFAQHADVQLQTTFGSTGKLAAQILNGAPFEVLLAADDTMGARLEQEGMTVPGSRFIYATGRLVLWSPRPDFVDGQGEVLRTGRFDHLALAAPRLAPYGAAAIETLQTMGLLETLRPRFVQGENIAQTHQFVTSGNAALGFVALSQVSIQGKIASGSGWIVPEGWHRPLRQEAMMLTKGANNPTAGQLLQYLTGEEARQIIQDFGYTP